MIRMTYKLSITKHYPDAPMFRKLYSVSLVLYNMYYNPLVRIQCGYSFVS